MNDTTPNNDSMVMEGTPIEGKPEFHSDMDAQVVTSIALLESVTSRQEDVPQLADLMNLSEGQLFLSSAVHVDPLDYIFRTDCG